MQKTEFTTRDGGTMIEQTIRWYIGFSALHYAAISIHSTVYVLYLLSKGLDLFEVNLVNVVFYVTLTLFEIPTGAYADIFGRKSSFVLSAFAQAIGAAAYFCADSLLGFMLAEAVLAIGVTLMSGAFDAWAVDRLQHFGHNGDTAHVFARRAHWQQITAIVMGLLGAAVGTYSLALPWLISAILFCILGLLAHTVLKEEYFRHERKTMREGLRKMKNIAGNSIVFGWNARPVRFLLMVGLVQYFSVMAYNMQWQPWFEKLFANRMLLGWLWVGMSVCTIGGNKLSLRLRTWAGSNAKALLWCQYGIAITGCMTVAVPLLPPSLAAFLLQEFPRGAFRPLSEAFLHAHIPSAQRATVGSFQSMAHHIGGAGGLLVSGLIAREFGIPTAWYFSGLILVAGSYIIFTTNRREN